MIGPEQGVTARGRSTNTKTGDIPQITLTSPLVNAQSWPEVKEKLRSSCKGCPLLTQENGSKCYAWAGRSVMGTASMMKSALAKPERYSMKEALRTRKAHVRAVRLSPIGDPSAALPEVFTSVVKTIRDNGLRVLAYTHFWKTRGSHLKGQVMASCDSLEDADLAVDLGWRATVVIPSSWPKEQAQGVTPGGNRFVVCPAMLSKARGKAKPTQCNDCKLCDATLSGPIVAFPDHGVTASGTDWRK